MRKILFITLFVFSIGNIEAQTTSDSIVMNYLKEMERTCITLFYMEDQSIEKIAGITGCPAGTVKSHLSRAKDKMASYLKQNGYDGK